MDFEDKQLFMRRYASRIINTVSCWSIDKWIKFYIENGEDAFLTKLEDEEDYTAFCRTYYDILREAFNIDSCGMYEYYQMYKEKFGNDEDSFRNELRKTPRLAKLMKVYF